MSFDISVSSNSVGIGVLAQTRLNVFGWRVELRTLCHLHWVDGR